jgi:hypothetical protein
MSEYEEFDSVTVAHMYLEAEKLYISFDDLSRSVMLDMKSKAHSDMADALMRDPNFWAQFINSFSTAINNHVESN